MEDNAGPHFLPLVELGELMSMFVNMTIWHDRKPIWCLITTDSWNYMLRDTETHFYISPLIIPELYIEFKLIRLNDSNKIYQYLCRFATYI